MHRVRCITLTQSLKRCYSMFHTCLDGGDASKCDAYIGLDRPLHSTLVILFKDKRNLKLKMPRASTGKKKPISVDAIRAAIAMVEAGSSIRAAAKEHGMHEWTLRDKLKKKPARRAKLGAETAIPESDETQLAFLLSLKSKWGFASTREEVKGIVQEFVSDNKGADSPLGQHLQTYCHFKVGFIW